ncbi:MAG: exonuclease SbcCD subunit D [Anaerolinea sp.]|nr:exonuclease SbcCD subunit D [Anaerolinea sp.]
MTPIRVLHFADVHIGMENYGRTDPETGLSSRVRDFIRRMNEMIDFARESDVDITIFAGDAFKTRTPNPTYQREFAWAVRDLTELAPLVMLVGNHDLPPTQLKASSIEIYDTLAVPNVTLADEYAVHVINTKRGQVAVGAAPYPIRARLLEEEQTSGLTIAETDELLQGRLSAILDQLATEADQHDMPRILTGHFTVNGASWGSERGIMLGRDIQVMPSDVADPRWDYVALGHIHKHQNLTEGREGVPPVVYSGSLERIDFGEEHDPKGYCWVEIERGKAAWQFRRVNARPFVTVRADLRQSDDPTADLIEQIDERVDLDDAIVRVIVDLTPQSEARFNEAFIRDALRHAGVNSIAAIRKEVEQPLRARLGGSPEGLSDPELLDKYLLTKGVDPERRRALVAAAEEIFASKAGQESTT